jgi:uncharacterized membrane protein (DUF2068 family)
VRDSPPARSPLGLRLIVLYKLVKAGGELLLAALLGALLLGGAPDRLRRLDAALRGHLTAVWSLRLTDLLAREATPRNVTLTVGALLLDGGLTLCEGWALYRSLAWAPWFVVVTTGSLLPFEVVELTRRPRAGRLLVLVVNVAVVLYLARRASRGMRDLRRRPTAFR